MNRQDVVRFYKYQPARHAIKTSIAAVLTIFIYKYFNLQHGYWSTITALIVMQSNMDTGSFEMTLKAASERLFGTVCGAALALLVLFFLTLSQWALMVAIFLIIVVFTYITKFYKGFNLAGVTAVIILLLSSHQPQALEFAWMRVLEIFWGVVVAVTVTLCVWPYRISDYLKTRRQARLSSVYQLLLAWVHVGCGNQREQFSKLLKEVEDDLEKVKVARKGLRGKQREVLDLEGKLLKSLRRLRCSYVNLPQAYWDFPPLQESTRFLLEIISSAIKELSQGASEHDIRAELEKGARHYEEAFDQFRSISAQTGTLVYSLDESFQMINTHNALQRCSERTACLAKLS